MSRTPLPSVVLLLPLLLQHCVQALEVVTSMPYLLSVPQPSRLPRLLKLDLIGPISSPPIHSATPDAPPSVKPPWSPPPPLSPIYSLHDQRSPYSYSPPPPSPYPQSVNTHPRRPYYSYTAIVSLPIVAVVIVFICSFVWGNNQRVRPAHQAMPYRNPNETVAPPRAAVRASWQDSNKGLNGALVNKLPTVEFTAEQSREGRKQSCAVCISDFEAGETVRLLPACGHSFHMQCIDMWLFSHSTCPLCRLSLFTDKGDLILLEEAAADWQRGGRLAVDPGTSCDGSPRRAFLPFIKGFSRSTSSRGGSQPDMARTRGRIGLQRSVSQPIGNSKVYPSH